MRTDEAFRIISLLADGTEPYGEENPTNLREIDPITIRAICIVLMQLVTHQKKEILRMENEQKKAIQHTKSLSETINYSIDNSESLRIRDALAKTNFNEKLAAKELKLDVSIVKNEIFRSSIFSLVHAKKFLEQNTGANNIDQYLETLESRSILEALKCSDSRKSAAIILGITKRSLKYRINKLNLKNKLYPKKTKCLGYLKYRSLDKFLMQIEKEIIFNALEIFGNNQFKTAKFLGITYRSFRYRMDYFSTKFPQNN
jgi:transcriptional regulator with PAS, ATPase and Fis domain